MSLFSAVEMAPRDPIALLLERVAEQACGDAWRNIRDDLRRIKLAQ